MKTQEVWQSMKSKSQACEYKPEHLKVVDLASMCLIWCLHAAALSAVFIRVTPMRHLQQRVSLSTSYALHGSWLHFDILWIAKLPRHLMVSHLVEHFHDANQFL